MGGSKNGPEVNFARKYHLNVLKFGMEGERGVIKYFILRFWMRKGAGGEHNIFYVPSERIIPFLHVYILLNPLTLRIFHIPFH